MSLELDRNGRVVSVLVSDAVGPGFKSQPRRCRATVLGKLFAPIVPLFTKHIFKPVNIWQSYKEERGCLMHFARLANTLLKDEESARINHI